MITVKALLMSVFSFWRVDLPAEALNFGVQMEVVEYKNNKELSKISISKDDPRYVRILEYLKSQKWKNDVTTYAPSILVRGNGVTLNCRQKNAVIYYSNQNNKTLQFSSDTSDIANCGLPSN
jgi:hypothetical protein